MEGLARLTNERDQAEIIPEIRTPCVSIERSEFLVGIPGLPVGAIRGPFSGTLSDHRLSPGAITNVKQRFNRAFR